MPRITPDDNRRAEIGRARREKTRSKLIAAAARVVGQMGQAKATIDDFIQAAGVARGTFYNYFPTREHLIDALWAHVGREPFLEIHNSCAKIKDPGVRFITETRLFVDRSGQDEVWGWLVYSLSGDPVDIKEDLLTFPMPTLLDGVENKRFEISDVSAARDLIVNTVRGMLLTKLTHKSSPEYERCTYEMLLLSLGIDKTEVRQLLESSLADTASRPKAKAVAT